MVSLLSQADQRLGRLDGVTQILPNPDLFVAMYVRREAVLSSQIEGTQSTLDDLLAYELDLPASNLPGDVEEVVNYVAAMNYGLRRLADFPLSLRLIREIHAELMQGVRGGDRFPGEFRRSQNWIGSPGATLASATFVPPPVDAMHQALTNLERYLHDDDGTPALVHAAIAHAQFETIHPFLYGNGRVGRLLVTFLLCHQGVLHRPLLYLSHYLKEHRQEYYDLLSGVRSEGDWEAWVRFFLAGVATTADEATKTAKAINALRENTQACVADLRLGRYAPKLIDLLFVRPLLNINLVRHDLGVAFETARRLVERLVATEVLEETTGRQRGRVFRFSAYLDLFTDDDDR